MQRVPSNGTTHNLPSPAASSSHKRTLSTLNRPSPTNGTGTGGMSPASISAIAAESPERASKRARFDASAAAATGASGNANGSGSSHSQNAGNGSGVKLEHKGRGDTTKEGGGAGVRWVLERVKDAVLAAALVMQHRAYSRKIGIRSKKVPLHLTQRLEHAWASYEATRRHIGAYMLACAQHAVTPSRPMPSTLPPPPVIASGPSGLTPAPLAGASPVGLGASSLLAFESDAEKLASSLASTKPPALAGLEALVFPNGTEMAIGNGTGTGTGTMPTQDNALSALGGLGGVDLSSLGMAELTAIINGENFDFAAAANPNPVTGEMATAGNGNGTGNGGPSAADIGAMLASASAAGGGGAGGQIGGVSDTQAETERLLAQLGGLPIPDTIDNPNLNASNLGNQSSVPTTMGLGQSNIGVGVGPAAGPSTATHQNSQQGSQQVSQQQPAQLSMSDQLGGELNVDDMLASLGGADGGFDFDFGGGMEGLGDLDLGNLSELAGLFEVTGDVASGEQAGGLMEMGQGQNQGQGQGQGEAAVQQQQQPQQQQQLQQKQPQQQQQSQQQQQTQQQQQQRPQQQQHGIGVGRGSQSAASGEQSQPASTQTQQPSSAAQQTQPESQAQQPPQATQPLSQEASSQAAPPPAPPVIPAQASASVSGLEGIMPSLPDTTNQLANPTGQTAQTGEIDLTADFGMQNMGGYGLGGIDMDDFDFGDGAMPVVNEDDFESLFAEFD